MASAAVAASGTTGAIASLIITSGTSLAPAGFAITGTSSVIPGGRLVVAGPAAYASIDGSFANAGTLDVAGGTLEIDASTNFLNSGSIHLWGGSSTLKLNTSLIPAELGAIGGDGTVIVDGTLDNSGDTLALTGPYAHLQLGQQQPGVLQGGTVVNPG